MTTKEQFKIAAVTALVVWTIMAIGVVIGITFHHDDKPAPSGLTYAQCQEDEVLVAKRFDGPVDADYRCVNVEEFVAAELGADVATPAEEALAAEFVEVLNPACVDLGSLVITDVDGVVRSVRITADIDDRFNTEKC